MTAAPGVWVFSGAGGYFPAAVFDDLELARGWIAERRLTGTLTWYPTNRAAYDWAVDNGYFEPKDASQTEARFIQTFSSAYQEHYHFEDGQ